MKKTTKPPAKPLTAPPPPAERHDHTKPLVAYPPPQGVVAVPSKERAGLKY
jgi:hypothetical protein